MNASGLALRGFQAGLHSALGLLERWSTILCNPALIADPPESLSITVLFRGALTDAPLKEAIYCREGLIFVAPKTLFKLYPMPSLPRRTVRHISNSKRGPGFEIE